MSISCVVFSVAVTTIQRRGQNIEPQNFECMDVNTMQQRLLALDPAALQHLLRNPTPRWTVMMVIRVAVL